jgi:hypothetical protein
MHTVEMPMYIRTVNYCRVNFNSKWVILRVPVTLIEVRGLKSLIHCLRNALHGQLFCSRQHDYCKHNSFSEQMHFFFIISLVGVTIILAEHHAAKKTTDTTFFHIR